jgi:hypothetical protein
MLGFANREKPKGVKQMTIPSIPDPLSLSVGLPPSNELRTRRQQLTAMGLLPFPHFRQDFAQPGVLVFP